jgi:hypothetical protein
VQQFLKKYLPLGFQFDREIDSKKMFGMKENKSAELQN